MARLKRATTVGELVSLGSYQQERKPIVAAGKVIATDDRAATRNDATIRLTNISKSFSGVLALRDVTVEFYPGEVHAILGENGAARPWASNPFGINSKVSAPRIVAPNRKPKNLFIQARRQSGPLRSRISCVT